ncbi:MAG: SDR family oxidoreductase [Xanthobacteraceae bacterium]|nr:MAG: SDR family oxidoreductase [Xanthobacteraceae bacterium]
MGLGDDKPLNGYHAAVTGGTRGIGLAIAGTLAKLGADVTLMGRNREALAARAAELAEAHGTRVAAEAVDVGDAEAVKAAFASATARLGPVTILINNAGIAKAAPFGKTDLAFWQNVMNVDLTGAFLCAKEVVKGMTTAGFGRIVNVASTAGLTGMAYCTAYCAAKHGLIGMTRALARELAKTPVTVNAVCPGYTDTDIVRDTLDNITSKTGRSREQALADIVVHNPQGRLVDPKEVADAVGWLCLPSSAAITGQSLVVAGGELM